LKAAEKVFAQRKRNGETVVKKSGKASVQASGKYTSKKTDKQLEDER
jgi:hypothetical protein